jgi:hypothetical protein
MTDSKPVTVKQIRRARDAVALLVADDPAYVPIFERLELELAAAEATDPVEKARAIAAVQRLIAVNKSRL